MKEIPKTTKQMLQTLRQVAAETLEKKRRLGQYAVIWENGKPVIVGDDAPKSDS